jgi:large conductance mechanosensitive channel
MIKSFMKEFKEFVLRGNVMDLAVGVIIGAAFKDIVDALTADFIQPLINSVGGAEIGGTIEIWNNQHLNYGHFLTAVINFIIMAFILFSLLKSVNKVLSIGKKKTKKDDVVKTKTCPFCKSEIDIEATRCPHCTSELPKEK